MNRRDALSRVALIMGGAVIGAEAFLSGCKTATKYGESINFTPNDIAYLDEIAETILPKTNTPGAKDAQVGAFMQVYVKDCYEEKDQKTFMEGMGKLNDACNAKNGKNFMDCSAQEKHDFLVALDKEAKDYQKSKKEDDPNHYFTLMKQLTLFGFFTSKPGATEALRYVAVPGRYEGCIPYKKGDKAWAT